VEDSFSGSLFLAKRTTDSLPVNEDIDAPITIAQEQIISLTSSHQITSKQAQNCDLHNFFSSV
jgi:hypothetical protein